MENNSQDMDSAATLVCLEKDNGDFHYAWQLDEWVIFYIEIRSEKQPRLQFQALPLSGYIKIFASDPYVSAKLSESGIT